jgi:hypothetical protein
MQQVMLSLPWFATSSSVFEDAKWNQLEDMENPDLPRAGVNLV